MSDPIQASPDTLFALAVRAEKLGDDETAVRRYREAIDSRQDFFEAHHNLAVVLTRLGLPGEAVAAAIAACRLAPNHPVIRFTLAVALEQSGAHQDAVAEYRQAQRLRPNYIDAASNLGRLLLATGKPNDATSVLEPAIRRRPDHAAARVNLGNAYLELGLPDAAAEQFTAALISQPALAVAQNSLAVAYSLLGRHVEALAGFRRAVAMEPENAEGHENLALELLRQGQFSEGWKEYEWRWRNRSNAIAKRVWPAPLWDGGPLDGRKILVLAEQGYGDALQFVRFAPLLAELGGRVVVEARSRLVRLFQNIRGVESVAEFGSALPENVDVCVPMLSLPRLLSIEVDSVPADTPYISVPDDANSGDVPPPGKLNVGIAWSGSRRFSDDPCRERSCPPDLFARLAHVEGVRLINLQIDASELDLSAARIEVNPARAHRDFADTAASVRQLDLIVTVDTALGHLAGSLGTPCWVLLPFAAQHLWMIGRNDSPWYPKHQLFRQTSPGDWGQPFKRVAKFLSEFKANLKPR